MQEPGSSTREKRVFPWGSLLNWSVIVTGFMTFAVYGMGLTKQDVTNSWNVLSQAGREYHTAKQPEPAPKPAMVAEQVEPAKKKKGPDLGKLAAKFESNNSVAAIGYDRAGGTSYGKYQLSSRAGSLKSFVRYLKQHEPEWAAKLEKSGPANTRGRQGKMPSMWKEIAEENPVRFGELQDEFIMMSNYQPARKRILAESGLDMDKTSLPMRKVLHSTAVQHGGRGAARIFKLAMEDLPPMKGELSIKQEAELIKAVYATRKKCFGRSPKRVRNAVKARLVTERDIALTMIEAKKVAENDA